MKLGSLFDGSGGFPLAGTICGMEPVWASEIESYPLRVTAARFPYMEQLGDVLYIDGSLIPWVDVITFGSPCQDLSVAGKQAGIHKGTRSCLFFEAVRVISEMRRITHGKYPRFAVWENVPGALSSNKGEDFRAVLEALCKIADPDVSVPEPPRGEDGKRQAASWETVTALPGASLTLNTSESPSAAVESTLWQILEANVPEKYYLSAKACAGILRRAERRGKKLQAMLEEALREALT